MNQDIKVKLLILKTKLSSLHVDYVDKYLGKKSLKQSRMLAEIQELRDTINTLSN